MKTRLFSPVLVLGIGIFLGCLPISGTAFGETQKAKPRAYRAQDRARLIRITNPETHETMVINWPHSFDPTDDEINSMLAERRAKNLNNIAEAGRTDIPRYQRAAAAVPSGILGSALLVIVIAACVIALWLLVHGFRLLWQHRAGLGLKAIVSYTRRSIVPAGARFCAVYFIYLALVVPFAREPGTAILLGLPFSVCIVYAWQRLLSK
jgi:uncharacterized iron-regulated membrane protein